MNEQLCEASTKAELAALLPGTDAQYELWARENYPHIMWLYDVLMGRIPVKPAASPAGGLVTFGVNQSGNPTITVFGAGGVAETFTYELPDEWREGHPLWDGRPRSAPRWAEAAYAGMPEPGRPTGWRALVIYSGEIFKCGWPDSAAEPNTTVTMAGISKAAACFSGQTAEAEMVFPPPPPDYEDRLMNDPALLKSVLVYLRTSSGVVNTPAWNDLAADSEALLATACRTGTVGCKPGQHACALNTFLEKRQALLAQTFNAEE
jgi:hypothetical protein